MAVTYGGIQMLGAVFPFGMGGASTCTLFGVPAILPRTGTLTISDPNSASVSFSNCVLQDVSEINGFTAYHVHDRRARLDGLSTRAEFNVPKNGGPSFKFERPPQDIASQLLDAMGETGYSVTALPNTARPYIKWDGIHPLEALHQLCDMLGCRLALLLNNTLSIRRLGTGAAAPITNLLDPLVAYTTSSYPANLGVQFGPTRFQSRLKLSAVNIDSSENFVAIETAVTDERVPWIGFQSISSGRESAEKSAYRFYRVSDTHPTALTVPGHGVINNINQLRLLDKKVTSYTTPATDADGEQDAEVIGKFFAGHYRGVTHATFEKYPWAFRIHKDSMLVEFDRLVFKTGSNGRTEPCTELFLETSFNIYDDQEYELVARKKTQAQSGDVSRLDYLIQQEKLYATYEQSYDSSNLETTNSDNTTAIDGVADNLISAALPCFQQLTRSPAKQWGIRAVDPDGTNHQVTWVAGIPARDVGEGSPYTLIGYNSSPFTYGRSYGERRRV